MEAAYLSKVGANYSPNPNDGVRNSLFQQYERVVFESLLTTFGLDMFIRDQHGGDVDTLHSVRQIGKDGEMHYKSEANKKAWEEHGKYDSYTYHSHGNYIAKNREVSEQKKSGTLRDAYTGKKLGPNDKVDLDHVISAKEIHDDRGRVLAGLKGEDLANSPENLKPTNARTNRSKKQDSMEDFLKRRGDEYTDKQKERMLETEASARQSYEAKLAISYYTSREFLSATALAAGNVGMKMGLRQAVGFVLAEIWFVVRDKLEALPSMDLKSMLRAVAEGVKEGVASAREKFKQILSRFKEGLVSGLLASLTTTLCNIFFTTAKRLVRILRQCYASIVSAGKILLFNPDNLPFGERMLAALKVLATGASAVVGLLLAEALKSTGLGAIPEVGDILCSFVAVFATGILSCTLLYALDNSTLVKKLVELLNCLDPIALAVAQYRQIADNFERLAAELLQYDLDEFRRTVEAYSSAVDQILAVENDAAELSRVLDAIIEEKSIQKPYIGDFDSFMSSKNNTLTFN